MEDLQAAGLVVSLLCMAWVNKEAAAETPAQEGSPVALLEELSSVKHTEAPTGLWFSPDGRRLATVFLAGSGAGHKDIQLWDAATGQPLTQLAPPGPLGLDELKSFARSADGSLFAASVYGVFENNYVRIWDVKTGREVPSLTHDTRLSSLAFSPDGRLLAGAGKDHLARVWRVAGDPKAVEPTAASARQDASEGKPGAKESEPTLA